MAEGRHNHSRHRLADNPFIFWNRSDNSQFSLDTVVGPTLQFPNYFEVFGRSHLVQNAGGWISTRYQPVSICSTYPGNWWQRSVGHDSFFSDEQPLRKACFGGS